MATMYYCTSRDTHTSWILRTERGPWRLLAQTHLRRAAGEAQSHQLSESLPSGEGLPYGKLASCSVIFQCVRMLEMWLFLIY